MADAVGAVVDVGCLNVFVEGGGTIEGGKAVEAWGKLPVDRKSVIIFQKEFRRIMRSLDIVHGIISSLHTICRYTFVRPTIHDQV